MAAQALHHANVPVARGPHERRPAVAPAENSVDARLPEQEVDDLDAASFSGHTERRITLGVSGVYISALLQGRCRGCGGASGGSGQ